MPNPPARRRLVTADQRRDTIARWVQTGHTGWLRRRTGLTQEQAARALGVSASTFARWETGFQQPVGQRLVAYHGWLADLDRKHGSEAHDERPSADDRSGHDTD